MVAIIIRLVLFLVPIVALLLWIRKRGKAAETHPDGDHDEITADQRQILVRAAVIVALVAIMAVMLNIFDPTKDRADKVFIPPHVVDGEVVPGRFVDSDSPEAEALKKAPPRVPKGEEGQNTAPHAGSGDDGAV